MHHAIIKNELKKKKEYYFLDDTYILIRQKCQVWPLCDATFLYDCKKLKKNDTV